MNIRPIDPAATHELRHRILRPNQTLAEMVYPGDDDPETIHFGAFDGDDLLGIVSLYRDPLPDEPTKTDWRFRGMAVAPDRQKSGIGRVLIGKCISHARDAGGERLWCNARTPAAAFYERIGFSQRGEIFDAIAIGPHVVMTLELKPL